MKLSEQLVQLGLSTNEASVYLALLELGTSQTGAIIKKTKLHGMLVYIALERLENARLVAKTRRKNVHLYHANAPERLLTRVEETMRTAQTILPTLQELMSKHKQPIRVETLIGREGFIRHLYEVIETVKKDPKREIRIMGGAGTGASNPIEITGEAYPDYAEACKKAGVKKLLLCSPETVEIYKRQFLIYPGNKLRVIEGEFHSPTLSRITRNMVSIEIYQPEILVLQIHHPQIAQHYHEAFETLWEKSRPVDK
jgi:sugar-specific transcriptional regulator TrmB